MPNGFALGIGGLEADLGDHICGLYSTDSQRDRIIIPFLEAGLASGDKCICVVDGSDTAHIIAMLDVGADVKEMTAKKQLEVIRARDMYLRSGGFAADEIVSSWKAAMSDVMYDGRFDVVRAVETWSKREVVPDMDELLLLESEMNRYLPLYPQVIVCLYDIERFGVGIIVNLLKSHRRMLVGEMLVENPYYVSPDELLSDQQSGSTADPDTAIARAAKWFFDETTGST